MLRSPFIAVTIFVLCCGVVGIFHAEIGMGPAILQLMIVAGLVVGVIDRHVKQAETVVKIDENTAVTTEAAIAFKTVGDKTVAAVADVAEKLNGGLDARIEVAVQSALAKWASQQEAKKKRKGTT